MYTWSNETMIEVFLERVVDYGVTSLIVQTMSSTFVFARQSRLGELPSTEPRCWGIKLLVARASYAVGRERLSKKEFARSHLHLIKEESGSRLAVERFRYEVFGASKMILAVLACVDETIFTHSCSLCLGRLALLATVQKLDEYSSHSYFSVTL